MTQTAKAAAFTALHRPGDPLVLFNIWDAGGARAVAAAGAKAIATASWAVAAAWGYEDGEQLPFALLETAAGRIAASVDLPVTVDMEAGFGATPDAVAANAVRLAQLGIVGINLEDQVIGGDGRRAIADQAARLRAIRAAVSADGAALFINARTDVFLQSPPETHADGLAEAQERAQAYVEAGADGLFAPGLVAPDLIGRLCADAPAPVNIFLTPAAPEIATLATLGAARISMGPFPYRAAMARLTEAARTATP